MNHSVKFIFSFALTTFISGCGFHKSLNMFAHSTIGLNIDRSPPSARVGITRDEKVITPMFAGGQKPTQPNVCCSAYPLFLREARRQPT
jgi:hypothetical protein